MSDAERAVALGAIKLIEQMRSQADEAEHQLLTRWRDAGLSWPDIADLYGITEQGMRQRFERLARRVKAPQ